MKFFLKYLGGNLSKTKKQRLVEKTRRLKNKRLLKKYPFLQAIDWWGRPIKSYNLTLKDEFLRGWWKAFGELMCDEIKEVLDVHNIRTFSTQQIKEKFGELHWYFSAPKSVYDEIYDIIDAYSHCSRNICIHCGKPDVHCIDTGWISPYCEKCFHKNKYYKDENYEDYICDEDNRMTDSITYNRFSKEGTTQYTVDISETTAKIRKRYEKCLKK